MPESLVVGVLLAIAIAILGAVAPGPAARRVERETVRYGDSTVDDARRRYLADAALYTRTGWAVHHLGWDTGAQPPTLVATYARYADEDGSPKRAGGDLRPPSAGRRRIAAILTAIAVPVITSLLLGDTGVSAAVGTIALLVAVVLGFVIGVRSEHLGRGPNRWLDWSVVIVGATLGLLAVLVFVVFLALFGSLAGLYAAAAASGVWLALRSALAVVPMAAAPRRQSP